MYELLAKDNFKKPRISEFNQVRTSTVAAWVRGDSGTLPLAR